MSLDYIGRTNVITGEGERTKEGKNNNGQGEGEGKGVERKRKRGGGREKERKREKVDDATLLALKMGPQAEECRSWKGNETDSPLEPPKGIECLSADTLISPQQNPFQTSDLQNYKVIHLCCFRPLTLR